MAAPGRGPRIPRKAWWLLGLVLVVVVSLVFALAPGKSASSSARPVKISGPGAHGVSARVDDSAPRVPGSAIALGSVWHIGPDGPLAKPVTIRLPLSHAVPANQRKLVLVLARESLDAGHYTPLPTKVVDGGKYAQVTVHRLSWFTPIQIDVQGALSAMKGVFDSLTSGAYTPADQPQCPNHTEALQGYKVWSQGKGALLWCFGKNNKGTRIVTVVSNRRYALLLTHQAMSLMSSSVGTYLQNVGKLLSPGGVVLYPRDTASFNADEPVGGFGKVVSDVGQEAQLMSSLDVGIKAMLSIITRFGYGEAPNAAVDILNIFLSVDACRASAPDAAAMVASCLSPKQLTEAFGKTWGLILVPIMTVSSVVNYFQGAINGIFDSWNQRAQFGVGVRNTSQPSSGTGGPVAPTDQYLGMWNHHTNLLFIRSNLAASLIIPMGPCYEYDPVRFASDHYTMCQEDADIGFEPSGNGLAGTVNLVDIAEQHDFDKPSVSVSTDQSKMLVHLSDPFQVAPYEGGVIKFIWPTGGFMTMCHVTSNGYHIGLQLKPGEFEAGVCGA